MKLKMCSEAIDFRAVKKIVVKVGTSTLTGGGEELDVGYMSSLVEQVCRLAELGKHVVLVTSGAIRTGMTALGLKHLSSIPQKQAAAAVGQGLLMQIYNALFSKHGHPIGQVLLTREDVEDRARFVNARNTFRKLFEFGAIPIVNENDTVAVDEIKFGDNDMLAAQVGLVVDADVVVLLSDVEGFYLQPKSDEADATKGNKGNKGAKGNKETKVSKAEEGEILRVVTGLAPEIWESAGGAGSDSGVGGMRSKLEAARITMQCGIPLVVAPGRREGVLLRILEGERVGTFFLPQRRLEGKKRWLAFAPKVRGEIIINEGARQSILTKGTSLLPVGVIRVEGDFHRGDVVLLAGENGQPFAKGIVNYSSLDVQKVAGLQTWKVAQLLGPHSPKEVVHRNNLVTLENET